MDKTILAVDMDAFYAAVESKSLGREHTFQHDTTDFDYLKDVLRLLAKDLKSPFMYRPFLRRLVMRSGLKTIKVVGDPDKN